MANPFLGLRMDPELHTWLVAEAKAQGREPSFIVRELIKYHRWHGLPAIPVRPPPGMAPPPPRSTES